MIFLAESIILCLLFTLCCIPPLLKNPLQWISDYPRPIQDRARELGLVDPDKKLLTRGELIRKLVGSLAMAILLSLVLVYVNGVEGFAGGFLWCYGFCTVIAWYDALVIDCLWFCHSKKVILPGTEDLVSSYHDYWFHIRTSLLGMVLGIPISLLVGLCVLALT